MPDSAKQNDTLQDTQPEQGKAENEPMRKSRLTPWWVYLVIFVLVLALTGAVWGLIFTNRGGLAIETGPTPRPLFVIITSTPTQITMADTNPEVLTPTPTPLSLPDETPESSVFAFTAGQQVEIYGTEGAGLSIRAEPGLSAANLGVGFDGDRFTITEGPREADGYQWWKITGEGDDPLTGWVVEDFLQGVNTP